MNDAERKAVGYLVRSGSDLFAATMGNKPIWDNREHMREVIAQHVEAEMALFDVPDYLAALLDATDTGGAPVVGVPQEER